MEDDDHLQLMLGTTKAHDLSLKEQTGESVCRAHKPAPETPYTHRGGGETEHQLGGLHG